MFLEKITEFSGNLPVSLVDLNRRMNEVTNELVKIITFIDFTNEDAQNDLSEVLQILNFFNPRGKRVRPADVILEGTTEKQQVFNFINQRLYSFSIQNAQRNSEFKSVLSFESIVTLCLLYIIDDVLNEECYEKLQNVLRGQCLIPTTCTFVVWCLMAILRKTVSHDFEKLILPTWIPRKPSVDLQKIIEMLTLAPWPCQMYAEPSLDTFWEWIHKPNKALTFFEHQCGSNQKFIVDELALVLINPKFSMRHVQKLTQLTEIVLSESLVERGNPKLDEYYRSFSNMNFVREEGEKFETLLQSAINAGSEIEESASLDLLSTALRLLPTIIYNDTKNDILNLARVLFKSPSDSRLNEKFIGILCNSIDELNVILAQRNDLEWLFLFLLSYPDMLIIDAKINYIDTILEMTDNSQSWQMFSDCFDRLKQEETLRFVEKYTNAAETLYRALVVDEETKQQFLEFAAQHKSTIIECLDRHDMLTDFLYSIFASNPSYLPFDSKMNNSARVTKFFAKSEQENLLSECRDQFQNNGRRREIAIAYFNLLLNFSEQELSAITEANKDTTSDMLALVVSEPEAQTFYLIFWRCQHLLSVDVRVKYCGNRIIDFNLADLLGFQNEMLSELEKFDDSKNMFDYLAALDILLSKYHNIGEDADDVKKNIVDFALKHKSWVNQEFIMDERFFAKSDGPLFSVLKTNSNIFNNHVKIKFIRAFGGKENEALLWLALSGYLQQIMKACNTTNARDLSFEADLCNLLTEFERDNRYLTNFAEKYKPYLNNFVGINSIIPHSPILRFFMTIPNFLSLQENLEARYNLLKTRNEKYNWLEECFGSFALWENRESVLMMIDIVCGSLKEEEAFNQKLIDLLERYTNLIQNTIVPLSRTRGLNNLQTLFEMHNINAVKLETRLAMIQNRLKPAIRETIKISIDRTNALESSFFAISELPASQWSKKFKIEFKNEAGVDAGGLLREWFTITTRDILNPNFGLFIPAPGDVNSYMINKSSHVNQYHLRYFKFIGRFLAKGVLENIHFDCPLTKVLYKQIVGAPVEYGDFESQDPEYFNSLCYILNNPISEAGLDLTFSTEIEHFGALEEKELVADGKNISVTDENKKEYVKLVSAMKMTESIRDQLKEFRNGFYDVIPQNLIMIFNPYELEMLLCGRSEIDIEDLKTNTTYQHYRESDNVIQWFWEALRSFNKDDRARFLMYATGSSKAPLTGFASLRDSNGIRKFNICKDPIVGDRLPSAHTCFNQLDLPQYTSYEILREKLLLAIREGSEGFGMS